MWIYDEKNPWTKRKEQFEANSKDFSAENTLGIPTEQDIKDLPKSINLLDWLPVTYNQWNIWACTAFALTHIQLYQNCKEFESSLLELDPMWLWRNMWHDPLNKNDWWDYLESALRASVDKWIPGKWPTGKSMVFSTTNYAYKAFGSLSKPDIDYIKWQLSIWHPLYVAIKWTSKTWKELDNGELVTVYSSWDTTWWHAVAIFWIDDTYVYFANSWNPRRWETLSTFKILISKLSEMITSNMISWRYWIVYDKKDIVTPSLFEDYYKEKDSEEYIAVKFLKDAWIIKWSKNRLMPNEPITREQMCLLLYRFADMLAKAKTKVITK